MASTRRDFLVLWGQAALAAHQHSPSKTNSATYVFRVFSPAEQAVLKQAAAILIPADERSGGAAAARVEEYIDFVVSHGGAELQQAWRDGLARMGAARAIEPFLHRASRNEFRARTADERFFVLLKSAVVEGFYTSEEGISKELGYQGMGFLLEFPDFSQEKPAVPAGHKPMLRAHA
jgi:hypothetical protein